ncbi:MAG: DUF1700 domain-containing protein [Lachnospiraceae bacterium]|nr:DUF1700 domain-containing protein [Lachnospiraceae bacterium]
MNEFLNVLKLKLMNRLTPDELDGQIALYKDYFKEQMAGGKTQEEILRKLGDPGKVADLIVEQYTDPEPENERQPGRVAGLFRDMTAEEINAQVQNPERGVHAEFKENEGWDVRLGRFKLNTWYGTLIILGIVLVLFVLISELIR